MISKPRTLIAANLNGVTVHDIINIGLLPSHQIKLQYSNIHKCHVVTSANQVKISRVKLNSVSNTIQCYAGANIKKILWFYNICIDQMYLLRFNSVLLIYRLWDIMPDANIRYCSPFRLSYRFQMDATYYIQVVVQKTQKQKYSPRQT